MFYFIGLYSFLFRINLLLLEIQNSVIFLTLDCFSPSEFTSCLRDPSIVVHVSVHMAAEWGLCVECELQISVLVAFGMLIPF